MSAAVFFFYNWFAIKQLKTQALYIANVEIKKIERVCQHNMIHHNHI